MIRAVLILVLLIGAGLGFGWMNATKLPQWYQASNVERVSDPVTEFSRIIQKQGIEAFFKDKLSDLFSGKLRLNEEEFNALVLTSLAAEESGRLLLAISDGINTQVDEGNIEIGSIISIDRIKTEHQEIVEKAPELFELLTILNIEHVYLAIKGRPYATNGELALDDNLRLKLGRLSVPNSLLGVLSMSAETLQAQTIELKNLFIKDIELSENQIDMAVTPTF